MPTFLLCEFGMVESRSPVEAVRDVVEPVLRFEGLRLWDVEYRREKGGMVLRLYIDREGGASLQDLSHVSRQLGDLLDVRDAIQGRYTLEVSTPGVNRKLVTAEHFKSFQGKRVRVKCFHPIEGRRVFLGILQEAEHEWIKIRDDAGTDWAIPIRDIAKANYEHVFPW